MQRSQFSLAKDPIRMAITCEPPRRLAVVLLICLAALLSRCGMPASQPGGDPGTSPAQSRTAVLPSGSVKHLSSDPATIIVLRRATRPAVRPQPVRVALSEHRETTVQDAATTVSQLDLTLEGNLVAGTKGGESAAASLTFDRIRLVYGEPAGPREMLSYDSTGDRAGQGNPLADLLVIVVGAQLQVSLEPTGRFVELNGLDVLWRKADVILAPPPLLPAQWIFRDLGMGELVAETLFPPMPQASVRVGESWRTTLPANVMLAAPLRVHLQATLTGIDCTPRGRRVASVRLEGAMEPALDIYGSDEPGIVPQVASSTHRVDLRIEPESCSLRQTSRRELELHLTLRPPHGGETRTMIIRQTRTLTVARRKLFMNN